MRSASLKSEFLVVDAERMFEDLQDGARIGGEEPPSGRAAGRHGVGRVFALGRSAVGWFLPRPAIQSELERLRAELVVTFNLIFGVLAAGVAILMVTVLDMPQVSREVAIVVMPAFVVGLGVGLTAVRVGALELAAHTTVANVFATMAVSALMLGGIQSSVVALWVMAPIVAGLLSGKRACTAWSGAVIATTATLFVLQQTGLVYIPSMDIPTYRATALINLSIACIGASAVIGAYETINANLRRTIALERAKFRYQAGHDILTQLPNRRLFMELQETALRRADRTKQKVGLFMIDLDEFKSVNDEHGHPAGDRMLQAVGNRLRRFLRVTDAVARLGGDEFAVLVELLDSREAAHTFALRLQSELSGDVEIAPGVVGTLSASIGVALYPDDGDTVEELHEAADAAMYAAKQQGGHRHRFIDREEPDDPFFDAS